MGFCLLIISRNKMQGDLIKIRRCAIFKWLADLTDFLVISRSINIFVFDWLTKKYEKYWLIHVLEGISANSAVTWNPLPARYLFFPSCPRLVKGQKNLRVCYLIDQNEKILRLQSGNRRFHSTETALFYFTDEIRKNMDEKKESVIVLLDMCSHV